MLQLRQICCGYHLVAVSYGLLDYYLVGIASETQQRTLLHPDPATSIPTYE